MAIKNCAECGQRISDQANACPFCGAPQKPKRKTSAFAWVAALLLGYAAFKVVSLNVEREERPIVKVAEQPKPDPKREAQLKFAQLGALQLKSSMKDPEAFDLKSVLVMPDGTTCYKYRAKNGFGAILPASAVLTSKLKMLLSERDGNGFVAAWNKGCTVEGGVELRPLLHQLDIV